METIPLREFSDYEDLSRAAADLILNRLRKNQKLQLGLATGFSPTLTYHFIGEHLMRHQNLSHELKIVQLDEWIGTSAADQSSCNHYLQNHVIKPWGLESKQCLLLDGTADNPQLEINKLKEHLSQKPLDLCILGLGRNGHLALNEPGSKPADQCRIVDLQPSSQEHAMLSSRKEPVLKGMTIGLSEIIESKEILLLVSGDGKKLPFSKLQEDRSVSEFPAAVLFNHTNWSCFADRSSII